MHFFETQQDPENTDEARKKREAEILAEHNRKQEQALLEDIPGGAALLGKGLTRKQIADIIEEREGSKK